MNFFEVLWSIIAVFFLFAYLMLLFQIFADIFRDDSMNGWLKAVWIFFLLFVPYLTALVYVIARGKGMAARSVRRAHEAEEQTAQYIRQTAGTQSAAEQISSAKSMLDEGLITNDEFGRLKAKALA
ncbi:PLDc N-terminal domain-containing protein [Arthrobacter sp. Sa2BUA2]|uniref:PLDc N-terminal domain-containing protein n=1 Tax=Arthrobacter pullicola TaxID=2762224 RepID=A0ABR8YHS8_9MICC|nr:PLDc N-terminal domain-containing protein [Arthrobacter pullicola]MBD8043762.1 PLDc N-terminal domain-containing protein [Arthrobacter pullicola]